MSQSWSTKAKDLKAAQLIMEEYAVKQDSSNLGLFEIVVNPIEKSMNYRLSGWVTQLAKHFATQYGADKGDVVTRNVLSQCITNGETLH
jgi:hypothetical protein